MQYLWFVLLAAKTLYTLTSNTDFPITPKVDWTIDTLKYNDGSRDIVKSRISVKRNGNKVETKITQTHDKCGNLIRKRKTLIYHGCFSNEKVKSDKNFKSVCE